MELVGWKVGPTASTSIAAAPGSGVSDSGRLPGALGASLCKE